MQKNNVFVILLYVNMFEKKKRIFYKITSVEISNSYLICTQNTHLSWKTTIILVQLVLKCIDLQDNLPVAFWIFI